MLALALGFLALVFVYVSVYAVDDDTDCSVPASFPEQTNWRYQISPWPPGGDCVYELPNGTEVVRNKPVPWFEWIFLAFCAGVAVLVSWAWGRVRRAARAN